VNLILIQLFIAILDGHYTEYESQEDLDETEKFSFLAWIIIIIREEAEKVNKNLRNVKLYVF